MRRVTVVGIVGSLRAAGMTRLAVQSALDGAGKYGADTRIVDLRDYQLPFCNPDGEYGAEVVRLREDVGRADGLILGTPEYHGGYSGALKNAIDLMGFDEFEGRIVGLVGVSGGSVGAAQALQGLRIIGRSLHAWVIPHQVSVPSASTSLAVGSPDRSHYLARLEEVGKQVARFAALHTSDEAMAFLKAWEEAPSNPGGDD